jgi:polyketide synthase 7
VVVASRLDQDALSDNRAALPPLLSRLATRPVRRVVDETDTVAPMTGLSARLQGLTAEQRHRQLVDLVCDNAARVLGRPNTADINAGRAFQELGFDSLTAVELRNRLKTATGLTLSPTLIFDYPTPAILAEHLDTRLAVSTDQPDLVVRFNEISRELQTLLDRPDWKPEDKTQLGAQIGTLLAGLGAHAVPDVPYDPRDEDIHNATESELFAILDEELGS